MKTAELPTGSIKSVPLRHAAQPVSIFTGSWIRMYGALLDLLERQSLATIAVAESELATLSSRRPGGGADDASRTQAISELSETLARGWIALEDVAAARVRIVDGTFGRCGRCGGEVERSSLHAVPTVRHCFMCQT